MRTLVVGSGFVGRAVARRLTEGGHDAVLASRRPPWSRDEDRAGAWTPLDATDRDACARVADAVRADAFVLVHGPSDVTWCEANAERAEQIHVAVARNFDALAAGRRLLLVSTDNVFDGRVAVNDETTAPRPVNAYGRAKLAAEQAVRQNPDATVLRVSLVYGPEPVDGPKWLNFFAACVHQLRRGERLAAPVDLWTTPVLLDDVAAVTAAVLAERGPPLLHLGGPERISRADWAALIADRLGVDPALVVPTPRAQSRYASRPTNSCLSSVLLDHHPSTVKIRIRGVREGTALLIDRPDDGGST